MRVTYLGHASFKIECGEGVIDIKEEDACQDTEVEEKELEPKEKSNSSLSIEDTEQ